MGDNYLIACLEQLEMDMSTEIARERPQYAVFADGSFLSASAMVSFEQVCNINSPKTIRRVLLSTSSL